MRIRIRHRRRRPLSASLPAPGMPGRIQRQVQTIIGQSLQTALRVGLASDASEWEAERVADQVMNSARPAPILPRQDTGDSSPSAPGTLQRQTDAVGPEAEEKKTQPEGSSSAQEADTTPEQEAGKTSPAPAPQPEDTDQEETGTIQARGKASGTVALPVARVIHAQRGQGRPLPPAARSFFETRFGASFGKVRIHSGADAARLAEALDARAFTLGRDIFFNSGEYRPDAPAGRHLLAHELTHVLQQRRGGRQLQRRVISGRVSCFGYPRSSPIFRIIGLADGRGVVAALQQAVDWAVLLINDAVAELEWTRTRIRGGAPPAWPVVSNAVARGLRRRLRLDPGRRSVWTGTGPGSVELALRWYRNIARILAGDGMRYNCLGPDCEAGDDAWTYGGEYRIRLCAGFWNGGLDYRAITLIHEASHVYYDTEDRGRGPGSAYCLESFLCDYHGLNVCRGC